MTIERPTFPPRAESVDSLSATPGTGQPETGKRTSESRKPAAAMTNVIELSARRTARALPPENIQAVEFRETPRQRAGRRRNPLRYHYDQAAMAVVVAGKLHRGEPLRVDDGWLDEIKCLRKGAQAARFLADELARIVEEECRAMSDVVQFPQGYPRAQVDEAHAQAFRDLEGRVIDLDRMGEITEHLVADWCQDVTNERCLELANFAVQHLADMLHEFKTSYFAAWHGETQRGAS